MIRVASYLLIDEQFVPIEQFTGQVPDPNYVDGAIELNVNGVDVLTKDFYDYVDQLWSYIAQGLVEVAKTGTWKTYFPDQPTELSFRADSKRQRITIEVIPSRGRIVASADYDEFMSAMCEAGERFFRKMIKLLPQHQKMYENEMRDLETAMPYSRQS